MKRIALASLLALGIAACGSNGGGSTPTPLGGGATTAPQASPAPSSKPDVDNYGY